MDKDQSVRTGPDIKGCHLQQQYNVAQYDDNICEMNVKDYIKANHKIDPLKITIN